MAVAAPQKRRASRPARKGPTKRKTSKARARKISITVDERVLRQAEREAKRRGRTLSAHVTEALARDLRRRRLEELIEDYELEHGTIEDDELARIRTQWQG